MLITNFKITKQIENSKANCFCQDCLTENPDVEDGYSTCCNESIVDREEAIIIAKRMDIQKFLSKSFQSVASRYNFSGPSIIECSIHDLGKRFSIDLSKDIDIIVNLINYEIKNDK